jgi:hypothetical protein
LIFFGRTIKEIFSRVSLSFRFIEASLYETNPNHG